jgi:hypothetical protein
MRHDPRWTTFFDVYLNQTVEWDLVNSTMRKELQTQFIKEMAHEGLNRDPRAIRNMVPDEVWNNMPPDPEIVALEQQRKKLKAGSYRIAGTEQEEEIRYLTHQISIKKNQRATRIKERYRSHFFANRPTWDIERQFDKVETPEYEYHGSTTVLSVPERAEVANLLCNQPQDQTDTEIHEYRNRAGDVMASLCGKREMAKHVQRRTQVVTTHIKVESLVDPYPLLIGKAICPDCIGDETLTYEARMFKYSRPPVMNDHFENTHLGEKEKAISRGELIPCNHPKCQGMTFEDLDHYRSHTVQVHGPELRSKEQVNQRRLRKLQYRKASR